MTTSIGVIGWTRIDGDAQTLPTAVRAGSAQRLRGDEGADGGVWTSVDGLRWDRSDLAFPRQIASGTSWVSLPAQDSRELFLLTGKTAQPVNLTSLATGAPEGFVVTSELIAPASGSVVWELDGEVFVHVKLRTGLPWADIVGSPDGRFHVSVTAGGESISAASSNVDDLETTQFTVRPSEEPGLSDVVDQANSVVWSYDPGDQSPVRAIHGVTTKRWAKWDGEELVEVEAPWASDDTLQLAALDDGVLAAVTDTVQSTVQLWRSSNGLDWEAAPLPAEHADGTPLPALTGDEETLLSIFTDDGKTIWSTTDGRTFERLPDVPGIARRSNGTGGFVAPDPRSSPRISVSADGLEWESLDLSDLLDVDASAWDLDIDARIIDSTIYVTATRPDVRTLLIGHIDPPS